MPGRLWCIEYDDYKKTWELTLEQTEEFSNAEEALDLFEELIVKNSINIPTDVREKVPGSSRRSIYNHASDFFDTEWRSKHNVSLIWRLPILELST